MKDSEFVVRHGYVCSGYLDKDQIGSAKYSILAAVEEIFGGPTVGKLITAVTYCLSHYLKCYKGFTLGIRDVVTSGRIAKKRKKIARACDVSCVPDHGILMIARRSRQRCVAKSPKTGCFIPSGLRSTTSLLVTSRHLVAFRPQTPELVATP